jgi:hypothetical protein
LHYPRDSINLGGQAVKRKPSTTDNADKFTITKSIVDGKKVTVYKTNRVNITFTEIPGKLTFAERTEAFWGAIYAHRGEVAKRA